MPRSERQKAENEAVFRAANERVEDRVADLSVVAGRTPFLCECDNDRCTDAVRLSLQEYESVREAPTRFVMVPGHQSSDDRVVAETGLYVVAEKVGEAGWVAKELYPRGRSSRG